MLLKQQHQYTGMSKDMSSNKQSNKYFDAKNIRVVATDQKSTFALTNEAGTEKILHIPSPGIQIFSSSIEYNVELGSGGNSSQELVFSTNNVNVSHLIETANKRTALLASNPDLDVKQKIIGVKELRDSAIIISTDNNGFDCFWELLDLNSDNITINLLYMGDLGLSSDNLVQILYNYENSIIQKIYFADGFNQLRFFNIRQSIENGDSINLIDLEPSAIDVVSQFDLSQPTTEATGGGSHTAGMIQHAYNLYVLNGSQTTISPLSELIPIAKEGSLGGGEVNEVLGRSVNINIPNIDSRFTHIKIYSIKYTSYNENPEITVVADKEIGNFTNFSFTDTGNDGTTISIDAFIFLGSNPITPKHIVTKDNRLFPINITEKSFDVDLDCRALSFDSSGNVKIGSNLYYEDDIQKGSYRSGSFSNVFSEGDKSDSINPDYEVYRYMSNGSTYGGSGKYVDVELYQNSNLSEEESSHLQFFKDNEIYRLGIKFYNRLGQTSDPKWIMDFMAPFGNSIKNYNQLKVTLKSDFYIWLNDSSNFNNEDQKPVGYKIIRADRTLTDQTIHSQGFLNGMVTHVPDNEKDEETADIKEKVNGSNSQKTIIPSVVRMFDTVWPFYHFEDYAPLNGGTISQRSGRLTEVPQRPSGKKSRWRSQTWQNIRLLQFFSPDILFRDNSIDSGYELRVVGLRRSDNIACWAQEVNPVSRNITVNAKYNGGINEYSYRNTDSNGNVSSGYMYGNTQNPVEVQELKSDPDYIHDLSFFGPTGAEDTHAENQIYRSFQGGLIQPTSGNTIRGNKAKVIHEIYGSPELTQEGADFKSYNNDPRVRYGNHLKAMLLDNFNGDERNQVRGQNTIGAKCITFMLGSEEQDTPLDRRKSLNNLWREAGIDYNNDGSQNYSENPKDGVLVAEFVKNPKVFYVGSIYGGLTHEAKKSSSYIDIGKYNHISSQETFVESPGDTFVGAFTFAKMAKTTEENKSVNYNTTSEIVSITLETTVDLKNRNDLSLNNWDDKYQPHYTDYVKYNKVYSQQPSLIKSVGLGSKFKKIQEFDGRLMSSKEKIPGEFVDSWTDFLENETMDLDGRYGPINAVASLQNEIFCLQDTGVAQIAVNPRAQVQAKDGISLELGVGGILHDHKYLSTTTGCLNKWGVVSSESAFYFVDIINKGIMTFDGKGVGRMSDLKGFHHEFLNRLNYEDLKKDNSVLGTGLSLGYNPVNSDVYFSFHQPLDKFTIRFSEKTGEFMSYVDYIPSWYINKGSVLITTSEDNNQVWEHFKGKPNHFYGVHFPSSITFHSAPKGNEIIMNSASFAMELTDSTGAEVSNKGLTGVRVYNDYQDSGLVDLKLRTNIWKKFRNWKLNFPREYNTRNRVRGMWAFTEFEFNNPEGNKLILHDITTFYTQP